LYRKNIRDRTANVIADEPKFAGEFGFSVSIWAAITPQLIDCGSVERLRKVLQLQPALTCIGRESESDLAVVDAAYVSVEPAEPVDINDHVRAHFGRVVGLDGDAPNGDVEQLAPDSFTVVLEVNQPGNAAPAKLTTFGIWI